MARARHFSLTSTRPAAQRRQRSGSAERRSGIIPGPGAAVTGAGPGGARFQLSRWRARASSVAPPTVLRRAAGGGRRAAGGGRRAAAPRWAPVQYPVATITTTTLRLPVWFCAWGYLQLPPAQFVASESAAYACAGGL